MRKNGSGQSLRIRRKRTLFKTNTSFSCREWEALLFTLREEVSFLCLVYSFILMLLGSLILLKFFVVSTIIHTPVAHAMVYSLPLKKKLSWFCFPEKLGQLAKYYILSPLETQTRLLNSDVGLGKSFLSLKIVFQSISISPFIFWCNSTLKFFKSQPQFSK